MAKLQHGEVYEGPKAVFDGEEVGGVHGFYALDETGKNLLLQDGKPVRLVHVDMAPDNPDDGAFEMRVAGENDPPQITSDKIIDMGVDAHGETGVGT